MDHDAVHLLEIQQQPFSWTTVIHATAFTDSVYPAEWTFSSAKAAPEIHYEDLTSFDLPISGSPASDNKSLADSKEKNFTDRKKEQEKGEHLEKNPVSQHLPISPLEAKLSRLFTKVDGSNYFSSVLDTANMTNSVEDTGKVKRFWSLLTNSYHKFPCEADSKQTVKTNQDSKDEKQADTVVQKLDIFQSNFTKGHGTDAEEGNFYHFSINDQFVRDNQQRTADDKVASESFISSDSPNSFDMEKRLANFQTEKPVKITPVNLFRKVARFPSQSSAPPIPLVECYPNARIVLTKDSSRFKGTVCFLSKKYTAQRKRCIELELQLPNDQAVVGFKSGQFLKLFLTNEEGKSESRLLFPASPCDRLGKVKFLWEYSERKANVVDRYFDKLAMSDQVEIEGAHGSFFYRGDGWFTYQLEANPIRTKRYTQVLMIAMGFGVLPFYAVLNEAYRENLNEQQFTLLQLAKNSDDFWMTKELDEMSVSQCCHVHSYRFEFSIFWHDSHLVDFIANECPPPGQETLLAVCVPPVFFENYLHDIVHKAGFANTDRYVFFR